MNKQQDDLHKEYLAIREHLVKTFAICYEMPKRYSFIDEKDSIAFSKLTQQLSLYMNEAIQINLKIYKLSNQLVDNNELKS